MLMHTKVSAGLALNFNFS